MEAPVVSHRSIPVRYWPGGAIVLALLLTTLWINRNAIEDWFRPRPPVRSVAVLPLINLSNNAEQEYLS